MENLKNKGGRPRKAPDQLLKVGSMRLKKEHWEKIESAGLEQFRGLLDRWKPKH